MSIIITRENYYGNKTLQEIVEEENLPGYIFVENKDLVFEEEKNRIDTLDDSSKNYNNKSSGIIINTSDEFKIYKKTMNKEGNIYSVRFISIDNKYPNSELREYITNGVWADNYNFVYAVSGRGIFVYNAKERTYKTIVTGKSKYKIQGIVKNTLYCDDTEPIELNLN